MPDSMRGCMHVFMGVLFCMHVCVHVCVCMCMCMSGSHTVCIGACTRACTLVCVFACIDVCLYAYMHVHMHSACLYSDICMCVTGSNCMYVCLPILVHGWRGVILVVCRCGRMCVRVCEYISV